MKLRYDGTRAVDRKNSGLRIPVLDGDIPRTLELTNDQADRLRQFLNSADQTNHWSNGQPFRWP